ncbi:MAG: TraR/DksA family transcriptional regulator [Candidatus Tectomicrobia bacterium]|nr:TraR/DksA family transcriptional regulator [Candidatus Tectomicrobia bacterium]MBI3026380.1 TraR/DksA family transcriptional regulator [Candidatus Tectomicrobia bacterium]
MKHLTKQQLEVLKRRLLEVRREILGDVEKSKRHSKESGDDGTQDIADMAADTYSRQVLMDLGERERERLREVDAAFKRMDDGIYGICEETDEPIPFSRLEVIPYTRYTVAAQNEIERRNKGS